MFFFLDSWSLKSLRIEVVTVRVEWDLYLLYITGVRWRKHRNMSVVCSWQDSVINSIDYHQDIGSL